MITSYKNSKTFQERVALAIASVTLHREYPKVVRAGMKTYALTTGVSEGTLDNIERYLEAGGRSDRAARYVQVVP